MSDDAKPPAVIYRVRMGRTQIMCLGHLVWEGGIVYAIGEAAEGGMYAPEKVALEESDLELRHGGELEGDWYMYHGFVVVSGF